MNIEYIPKNYPKLTVKDVKKIFLIHQKICKVKKKNAEISQKLVEIFE